MRQGFPSHRRPIGPGIAPSLVIPPRTLSALVNIGAVAPCVQQPSQLPPHPPHTVAPFLEDLPSRHQLSPYPHHDARSIERELLRLIHTGQTHDALSLYQSIWTYDDLPDTQKYLVRLGDGGGVICMVE